MDSHACQSFDNPGEKPGKTQLGFFQSGVNNTATIDELYQYLWLPGRPRRKLEGNNKRKQNEISKFAIPRNRGGLLLNLENANIDY